MTTIPSSKFAKVRVFRFLDTSWTDILTGDMIIDSATRTLKIYYENSTNNHLIPACPAKDVQGDPRKLIEISVNRMSRVESDQTDSKIIYLWIDKNPFSISFLAEQKAKQTCQILQLLQQSEQILETQNQQEETSIEYLKNLIQSNPGMITTLFINNNLQTLIDLLVKLASLPAVQTGPPEDRQNYFLIFKSAIRVGDKNIIEKLISKENYQILLKVLSWNPFNKNPFNYVKEYDRMVSINNVLGITDPIIVQTYEENARIKFLRDVASCMFTEIDNERIFQSIININNQTLIFHIGTSDETLQQIKQKAESDPISFLNLFSELWEMYKSTNIEFQHKQIKQKFVDNFKQKGLHGAAVRAAFTILDNPKLSQQVNSRFHQKWLESFNPFLSNNWDYSQEWICTSKSKQCLIKLLQKLLTGTQDEHLIQIIVNFTRWLIQPSDNRLVMVAKFKCYVYDQLILKMWPIMKKSTILIQVYVDFILRAYRSDCVRARRVIIQNKVLSYLNKDLTKKSTLICVIKLLDGFLQMQNLDIFTYLNNNVLFKGLKQEYLRNARSRNIINSCFRCLLKKIEMTKNNTVRSYFSQIFLTKGIEA